MRYRKRWQVALLLGALLAAGAPRAEAQDSPERRARREAGRGGWIGVSFHILESAPEGGAGPAVIVDVYPESPADRAGVQRGDTVVRWNGRTDVASAMAEGAVQPGDSVRVRLRRGGRDRDLTVVASAAPRRVARVYPRRMGELPGFGPGEFPREMRIHLDSLRLHADSLQSHLRTMLRDSLGPRLREMERAVSRMRIFGPERASLPLAVEIGMRGVAGAELTEMNPGLAGYFGTDRGVLVLRVAPDTPASRAGLQSGDVVVAVDDRAVESVEQVRRSVAEARGREVELEVRRRGERQEIRMRWER